MYFVIILIKNNGNIASVSIHTTNFPKADAANIPNTASLITISLSVIYQNFHVERTG